MQSVTNFIFNTKTIRVVSINNEPWFVAADVCKCLGFTNPTEAVRPLDADEKAKKFLGTGPAVNAISESGLYKIVLRAQRTNPVAKAFQDWVTKAALPAIRKDGMYVIGNLFG